MRTRARTHSTHTLSFLTRSRLRDPTCALQEAESSTKVKSYPFSSKRKRSSYVVRLESGGYRFFCKGASELVLAECNTILDADGKSVKLSGSKRQELLAKISAMADRSLRTICLAYVATAGAARELLMFLAFCFWTVRYKDIQSAPPDDWEFEDISNLTCIGLMGIHDTLRPEVPRAIEQCKQAGIKVRMVTGDNKQTAVAIAKECGIYNEETDIALEGPEFAKMTNAEVRAGALLPSAVGLLTILLCCCGSPSRSSSTSCRR